ncbi:alpha-1,4-N-acetylglucosaminyltransferase-like [Discoglossus pictus]
MFNVYKVSLLLLFMVGIGYIYNVTDTETFRSYVPFFYENRNTTTFKLKDILTSSKPANPNDTVGSSKTFSPMEILKEGNGIIFIETTDRMEPPHLVLCAVESAARVYPDRPVAFFMKGLKSITTEEEENRIRNTFPTLSSLSNVYLFPLAMEEVFKDTPLLPWYLKVNPSQERYWTHVSSDGSRLALIWKYGGIYMDTDIISIKQIKIKDFLVAESAPYSSNGAFGFSPRQDFTWLCMDNFVKNYRGDVWGNQGPLLLTRILKQFCSLQGYTAVEDIMCGNITYMNPKRFYPIECSAWESYYRVWDKVPTFDDSYSLHLWNYMNRVKKTVIPGSNTLVDNLYKQYCPNIYDVLKKNYKP